MTFLKRHKFRIILAIILCTLVYITANVISICAYGNESNELNCDVAIVLGAACTDNEVSEVYKQRLNHAVDLYNVGRVDLIITTGGIGKGNSIADATVAKKYLSAQGIPADDVLEETTSVITQENLQNSKLIMEENGYDTALIVSDPLHMKRAMLIARDAGINAFPSPTETSAYKSLASKIPFVARETFFYIGYKWYRVFL